MWEGAVSAASSWPPHSKLLLFISDKEATRPLVNLSSSVTLRPFQILDREYTMASGVKVDEAVKMKFDDIKKKKNHRYLVFYIKDEKMICVEKVGGRDSTYGQFLAELTSCGPDDCR